MPIEKNNQAWLLLLIFISAFLLIVMKGLATLQPGDENVYYYMGRLISEGRIPYKDFFYAHPPLQIYILALAYKAFGFNIAALKLIPLISTLASAIFTFKIAKAKFGNGAAAISSLLFLFSYSIMFNSVFSFGVEIATAFLVIGLYFMMSKGNYLLSGLFLGLASVTRLLSLVPIFLIIAALLISRNRNFLKFLSAFSAIFIIVNGAFILHAGSDYVNQVYKFHLLKKFDAQENLTEYTAILKLNWVLFLSAFLFIFVKEKKPISLFAAISFFYLIFLAALKKLFGFYFIIAFPFLAVVGGYSIANLYNNANFARKWKIMVFALLAIIFGWNMISDILFLEKIGFSGFERGSDLAAFVNSVSGNETMLFGDDSVAPLLALMTKKSIAFGIADTNNQVFISGLVDLSNVLEKLKGKDILFILRDRQGISSFKEAREFLGKNCGFLSQFHDKIEGSYLVYKCG